MVQRDREGEGFVGCGENVFKLNEPGFDTESSGEFGFYGFGSDRVCLFLVG